MAERVTTILNEVNVIRTGPRGGTPVVFLHGVGLDLTSWSDQIEKLHHEFDVIAFDFPAHGLSKPLEGELTFVKFANVLFQLIEELSLGPVHLVGISFGGMVAQTAAGMRPDLVRSIALLGSACDFAENVRGILRERAEFVKNQGMLPLLPISLERYFTADFHQKRPDVIDRIKKLIYQQDPLVHAAMWNMISILDTKRELQEISLPALIIVGSEDTSTPVAAAQDLAEALRTELLHVVPNVSHMLNLEAPEAINNLLLDFLRSHRKAF
ncbi:3-oxoadipate enol-lactonase [Pedobacter westerhofensis]|uniref:3-oxoadipate enol-lactonase n=2 Tax=Pedobacter westerhofensis TaxID=425512 RepID=A0A521FBL1_9SPHI|nr:3-oxoadipate enol-lactonase [Pedobacter westerhofensis]